MRQRNVKDQKQSSTCEPSQPQHCHDGASSAEFRGMTEAEIIAQDAAPHPKHIWEGQDIWVPKDGSWFYCCNRPVWLNVVLALVLIACGMVEGFLFVRVSIVNPVAIAEQFRFRAWVVMKIFLMVVGTSMFVQALFDYISPSFFNETRATRYIKNSAIKSLAGGAFIGLGTLLCGSGPTLLPAQIGGNVGYSWVTGLGFIAGGLVTLALDHFVWGHNKETVDEHRDKLTIDEKLGVRYYSLAFPVGIVLMAAACCLEFVIPGTTTADDAKVLGVQPSFMWPAVAAGAWVGIVQLVFRLIAHHGEGGSTSVLVIISLLTWGKLAEKNFPNSFPRVWQAIYVWIGIPLGAFIAREMYVNGGGYITPVGMTPLRSFLGGMLSVIGAKAFGSGCICGASMTGSSEWGVQAMYQTLATFGVGIPAAFAGVPALLGSF